MEAGAKVHVQAEDCAIVSACPATVIVPLRGGPELGAIEKAACAGPDPEGVAVVIQSTLDDAAHEHPCPVEIAGLTLPPAGATS